MGVKIQGSKIYLPKVGWMRFHNSRPIPNGYVIKAATVRKRQNGWYVSIRIEDTEVPSSIVKPLSEVNKIIGCDLGITKLVYLSDGTQIENPKFGTSKKFKRLDKSNREREKFICTQCGHREHADIGAAKTIRDRASEMVRADCAEPSARHSNAQKISPRSQSKRGEAREP